jgi:hypothetical protein
VNELGSVGSHGSGTTVCAEAQPTDLAVRHRPELVILDFIHAGVKRFRSVQGTEKIKPSVSIILSTQHADLRDGLLGAGLLVDGR